MTNPCVELHAEALRSLNQLAHYPCDIATMGASDAVKQTCQAVAGAATDDALWEADEAGLCSILCCCSTNGGQACVEDTLDAAERRSLDDNRYKAEVSYNMQTEPPTPMMRKELDPHTLERVLSTTKIPRGDLGHLAGTAGKYFEDELQRPAGPGSARWRRPDVVITRGARQPRTTSPASSR